MHYTIKHKAGQKPSSPTQWIGSAAAIIGLVILGGVNTVSAQTASVNQQSDQIAIQLGAIELGYTATNKPFTIVLPLTTLEQQQIANALYQGRLAMATATNTYSANLSKSVATRPPATPLNFPAPTSTAFQNQYFDATLNALSIPALYTGGFSGIKVGLSNSANVSITGSLNPTLCTASQIAAVTTAALPNRGPALAQSAVNAAMAYTSTNGYNVPKLGKFTPPSNATLTNATALYNFNLKTANTQLANAGTAASAALTAACKAYKTGTKNWVAVSASTGPVTNTQYLPNFGKVNFGPANNPQLPTIIGLDGAVAAVSANAINGLGNYNTNVNTGTNAAFYGKTPVNVQALAKSLAMAAAAYQVTSVTPITGVFSPAGGAEAAEGDALISQVIATNNPGNVSTNLVPVWNSAGNTLLSAVIQGAYNGSKANIQYIAMGVAEGFLSTYYQTLINTGQYNSNSVFGYNNATNSLGVAINTSFDKIVGLTSAQTSAIQSDIGSGLNIAYTDFVLAYVPTTNGYTTNSNTISTIQKIAGAAGLNNFGLLNGVGSPVSDTVGL